MTPYNNDLDNGSDEKTALDCKEARVVDLEYERAKRLLHIGFDTSEHFTLSAEYLRVESPSAEVQGHHASQKKTIAGCKDITINEIKPIGHYAVCLVFSDGHDSGFYTWRWLYDLCKNQEEKWQNYLARLKNENLKREATLFK